MRKGIFQLLAANILYLLISILNSFLLPKFLSMETYAVIKTYTLYIGYAGFLSLGYADGMYLKYGGKDIGQIDRGELSSDFKSYLVMEAGVSAACLIVAAVIRDFVLLAFSVGSLCVNIIGYYKNLYQAVGDYRLYGKALNDQTILMFVLNMLLLVFRSDNAVFYIAVQVLTALLVMIYLTAALNSRTSLLRSGRPSFRNVWSNVSSGFTLMLGNFSSSIFTSLDRWFVKFWMDSISFAQYSFAVSLENIVNVFVTPITISLYNVFCSNREEEYVRRIKKMVLLWGCAVIAAAFPVKFVVQYFLPEYLDALDIIFPLFGAQAFYAVIKGIHVNIYKAEKKQQKYFVIMVIMIVVAVASNIIFYQVVNTASAFAWATYATAFLWFVYCEIETKSLRFGIREYLTVLCVMAGYFLAGNLENAIAGFGVYCLVLLLSVAVFMNGTARELLGMAFSFLKKKEG